jgi:hypothetical protein
MGSIQVLLHETLQMQVSMQNTKQPLVNRYQYSLISNISQAKKYENINFITCQHWVIAVFKYVPTGWTP